MISRICLLSVVLVALYYTSLITSNEIQMDRMVFLNSTYVEGYYNITLFRIAKHNHTSYSINFEGETFKDIDHEFDFEGQFYYNRLSNNQYTRSIIRIAKQNLCDRMGFYYPMFIESLKNYSNLPQYKQPTKLCPLKKVSSILTTFKEDSHLRRSLVPFLRNICNFFDWHCVLSNIIQTIFQNL